MRGGSTKNETRHESRTNYNQITFDGDNNAGVATGNNNTFIRHEVTGEVLQPVIELVRDAGSGTYQAMSDAMYANQSVTELAITENSQVSQNALNDSLAFARDSNTLLADGYYHAGEIVAGATDRALTFATDTLHQGFDFGAMALDSNERLANNAMDHVALANESALNAVQTANDNVTSLSQNLAESAMLANQEVANDALLINEQATRSAFDLVDNVTTSDTSQASIEQTKYMALAVGALGVAMIFMKRG